MHTVPQYKKRADRLRTHLQSVGIKITRSVALEAQAVQEGMRDWNTLAAAAPAEHKRQKKSLRPIGPTKSIISRYIGQGLPAKHSIALQAELEEFRSAFLECVSRTERLQDISPLDWSRFECGNCGERGLTVSSTGECQHCNENLRPADYHALHQMLRNRTHFLAFRWAISKTIGRPILGLTPYKPFDNQPSPLEHVCKLSQSSIVKTAAAEFGLDDHFGTEWSLSHSLGCEFSLGYYSDPEVITTKLAENGISHRQATSLGWTMHQDLDKNQGRSEAYGLVVTFLEDLDGGPPAFWGYRPKSLRAREGYGSAMYVVGNDYPRDTIYLGHLIDSRPLVLVTGFMHALALREAGINAVAVPFLATMSKAAINTIFQNRDSVVVCAGNKAHDSPTSNEGLFNPDYTSQLRFMSPLESYEGRQGFLVDQFLSDLDSVLIQQVTTSE